MGTTVGRKPRRTTFIFERKQLKLITDQIAMEFKNLLTSPLAATENTEVVVSEVTLPPNIELPKHWHPGEEFAYIIKGSLTLWMENKKEKKYNKGDACVVPLKKVHSVRTSDEGVTVLVFRVHEKGQDERYLVK